MLFAVKLVLNGNRSSLYIGDKKPLSLSLTHCKPYTRNEGGMGTFFHISMTVNGLVSLNYYIKKIPAKTKNKESLLVTLKIDVLELILISTKLSKE